MGIFERFLSVWVALSMLAGLLGGTLLPQLFIVMGHMEYASINFIIAILIWFMIYPMMIQIDFTAIKKIHHRPKGLIITLVINWLIKPFTMALLAILFIRHFFSDLMGLITPDAANQYIAGMILLGVAPCTAMVFVWSQLTKGDANYTLVQVAINDLIMLVAFAPLAAFLLGVTHIQVPWNTLIIAVMLYIVIPLIAGLLTRKVLKSTYHLQRLSHRVKPLSIVGLISTVILLFGFQASQIIKHPLAILLIAIPLVIQTFLIFSITYFWMLKWQQPHSIAAPGGMIGASNFFELAVAVAISLFGLDSGAALATVVGVLVEVPLMLALVHFANKTRHYFPVHE